MQKYFTVNDNFEKIIRENLFDVEKIVPILNGWTNFVFEVETTSKTTYIFRFPRNDFFSLALDKEIEFSKFINDKISYKTVQLEKFYNKNRLFSRHKKLDGIMLSKVYEKMSLKSKQNLAKDLALFMKELQSIDYSNLNLEKCSKFLDDLSEVTKTEYDLSKHDYLKKLESELVLCHGDLNPGNILMDNKFNVVAILDFAFVSVSSPINDLSRIIGRLPGDFEEIMLNQFNKTFNTNITSFEINNLIKMWDYVEEKYIDYIKIYHKDIVLPTLVRWKWLV